MLLIHVLVSTSDKILASSIPHAQWFIRFAMVNFEYSGINVAWIIPKLNQKLSKKMQSSETTSVINNPSFTRGTLQYINMTTLPMAGAWKISFHQKLRIFRLQLLRIGGGIPTGLPARWAAHTSMKENANSDLAQLLLCLRLEQIFTRGHQIQHVGSRNFQEIQYINTSQQRVSLAASDWGAGSSLNGLMREQLRETIGFWLWCLWMELQIYPSKPT